MIDTPAIRSKILDLAMRGKLTEQLPEDGTAEELYRQIQAERQSLIKAGKIKKEKPLPEIVADEVPLEIPTNWKLCRFGTVITLVSGTDYAPEEYNDEGRGVPYITGASNLLSEGVLINRWTEKPRCMANFGDVLLVCKGSGYGKVAMCDIGEAHIARQIMAVKKTSFLEMRFLLYFLMAKFNYLKGKGQGLIPGVDRKSVLNMQFLLPPLAEQHRIVARIDQAFAALDTIDALQAKYADNLAVLKSKLINAAIQGKLTEQLPEDGTAEELYRQIQAEKQSLIKAGKIKKEKPLPEIAADEIPFEIPSNWKWVRWGDVVNIVSARRVHQSDWRKTGVPFYRAREIAKLADEGFVNNELFISEELYTDFSQSGVPHENDLMVSAVGTLGRTYVVKAEDRFYYKDASVLCFENFGRINPYFLALAMKSSMMRQQIESNSGGTTVDTLTMVRMSKYFLPLPTLAEQKRIVERVTELFDVCDELQAKSNP